MDPDHGLEGDLKPGGVGCPSMGLSWQPKKMGTLCWGPLARALTRSSLGLILLGLRNAGQAPRSLWFSRRLKLGTLVMIDKALLMPSGMS